VVSKVTTTQFMDFRLQSPRLLESLLAENSRSRAAAFREFSFAKAIYQLTFQKNGTGYLRPPMRVPALAIAMRGVRIWMAWCI
jgi:hypothetical protein